MSQWDHCILQKPTYSYCKSIDSNLLDWGDKKQYRIDKIRHDTRVVNLFKDFAKNWYKETSHLSLVRDKATNQYYQNIIGLGEQVIPFVLNELENNGGHWFWALRALTRQNPVPEEDRGDIPKMRQAWLKWGCEHDYIK